MFKVTNLLKFLTASNFTRTINFYLEALTINRIHSPFYFKLCSRILDLSKEYTRDYLIEHRRAALLKDETSIGFIDLGAGSKGKKSDDQTTTTIKAVGKMATSPIRKCRLLRNLILFFKPKQILELGSNLGIMTAYMHHTSPSTPIVSVEGIQPIFQYAKETIKLLSLEESVELYHSSFESFFKEELDKIQQCDFVFLDGDHTYEGTLNYVKQMWVKADEMLGRRKVIVIDDIYWSDGMYKAWTEISKWKGCNTLDLYQLGIVIISGDLAEPKNLKCVTRVAKPWQLGLFG